jgi:preprotein translocase subunit SecD
MKTIIFYAVSILIIFCNSDPSLRAQGQKVVFGIFETLTISEIPKPVIDSLKTKHVIFEKNQAGVIGYITAPDTNVLHMNLTKYNFKLIKSVVTVDKEQKYFQIIAIRPGPAITNQHIKKTKANGSNVEIYFNYEGAKKWAETTKINTGRSVAFVINNQLYSLPLVNAEIVNGMAIITGLKNENTAKTLSESLNASLIH